MQENNESSFYQGLQKNVSEINRNFYIKVSGITEQGKIHSLYGVSGLIDLIGDVDLVNNLVERAFNILHDKCVCKLRRGITINFYSK